MEKWVWLVEQESKDPAKEREFQEWLDNVHLPSLLNAPGVVSATWYVNKGPMLDQLHALHDQGPDVPPATGWSAGQAKNLALYEIETEDMTKTWPAIYQWVKEMQQKAGWRTPLLKVLRRSVWQQATPVKRLQSK